MGSNATVALEWSGSSTASDNSSSRNISDTTLSPLVNAHLSTNPPKGSFASWWLQADTASIGDELFSITIPASGVIDVTYEFVLGTCEPNFAGSTIIGATAGKIYQRALSANLAAVSPYNFII